MVTAERQPADGEADVRDVLTGMTFNIQRFSVQDGPGIRTTVFVKGCPLRCPWCSNPESQNSFVEVGHVNSLCNHCDRCLEVCEPSAITYEEKGVKIDREKCTNCGKCVPVCMQNAMRLLGREDSTQDIYSEVEKDALYYRNSNGGITVSGGEPLNQPKLVAAIFKRAQEAGMHTCLDTSGYGTPSDLETVLEYTDLVMFDLKIMDPAAHLAIIGVPNDPILRNARTIVEKGIRMIIRIPLIPTLTDTEENIREIARFVKSLDAGLPVNILPYHRFGMNKYNMLGRPYKISELKPIPDEQLKGVVDYFEACGLTCEVIV